MNLAPTIISIGLGVSLSFLYLQDQKDEPEKINYRAALSEFEQSALAFAAKTKLDANTPQPISFCQNMNFEFGGKLAAGSEWELDITGLDCDTALLSVTTATAADLKGLISAATESGRAQDAKIDYSNRKISWTQRIYKRKASGLGFRATMKNNTLGSCLAVPCNQTNSSTSSTPQVLKKPAWSNYGNWSSCYQGSQQRTRTCINANPQVGLNCLGSNTESRSCNRPPTAKDRKISAVEKIPIEIKLKGEDPDNDPLVYEISLKSSGDIEHTNGENKVSYISNSETLKNDQFTYRACDSKTCSEPATVTIQIELFNDPPTAKSFTLDVYEKIPTKITLYGLDPENDKIRFEYLKPKIGDISVVDDTLRYTSNSETATLDHFIYKACDSKNCSQPATVTIQITLVNDPPTAKSFTLTANEQELTKFKLEGTDPEGNVLDYYIMAKAQEGEITNTREIATYKSDSDTALIDQFTYKTCENKSTSCSKEATVNIKIKPINDAPKAYASTAYTEEGKTKNIYLYGADVDSDVNKLTYEIIKNPKGKYQQQGRVVKYTALVNELIKWGASSKEVEDSLNYRVCDDENLCSKAATVIIKNTQINAPPRFVSITPTEQRVTATVGMDYSYEFKIVDSDYLFGSNPKEVSLNMPSWLKKDPNSEFFDTGIYKAKLIGSPQREDINSFNNGIVITAKDGWGTDLEQFTINVKPPIPTANDQSVEVNKDSTIDIFLGPVKMNDYSLIYEVTKEPAYGKLNNAPPSPYGFFITYKPDNNIYTNQDSFKFKVCDLDVCSEPATVTINIRD